MTALRFQTGGRHQTSPVVLKGFLKIAFRGRGRDKRQRKRDREGERQNQ